MVFVYVYCAFLHSFVSPHHQHDYSDLAQHIGVEHYAHTLEFYFHLTAFALQKSMTADGELKSWKENKKAINIMN